MASNIGESLKSSKDLLSVSGEDGRKNFLENIGSLLKSPKPTTEKPRIFQIARSPLLDQLDLFLPQMKASNDKLLLQSSDELDLLDVENTLNCERVIEMNLVLGEMPSNIEIDEDSHQTSDEEDDWPMQCVTENNLKVPIRGNKKKNTKKLVEEISDCPSEGSESTSSASAER